MMKKKIRANRNKGSIFLTTFTARKSDEALLPSPRTVSDEYSGDFF